CLNLCVVARRGMKGRVEGGDKGAAVVPDQTSSFGNSGLVIERTISVQVDPRRIGSKPNNSSGSKGPNRRRWSHHVAVWWRAACPVSGSEPAQR
ncbi:Unknown protein, partial [Striga hermonthica]